MKVCFFCKTKERSDLDRVGFYVEDRKILEELGYEVVVATNYKEIPNDVDLIFAWWWTWSFLALIKAWLLRVPIIVTGVFDYQTPPRGQRMCYLDRPLYQKILMRLPLLFADRNIFISDFEFKQITQLFSVRNPVMIPCSVDLEVHKTLEPSTSPEMVFFNIAWSGGFNPHRKCLMELLKGFILAAFEIKDIRLSMAGKQGEFHSELVRVAQESNVADRIEFLGPISQAEKVKRMQTCLAYLQPTRFEGFGLAIAEAMACGAMVITSQNSAVAEVVGNFGLFADPDSVESIRDQIKNAYYLFKSEPQKFLTLKEQGADKIRRDYNHNVRKLALKKELDLLLGPFGAKPK